MTDQEHLERAYRRLLAWYPREFRDENGPEILAVLMADAPDGKHRPGLAESEDLIRSGLWMRLRPSVPRYPGMQLAGPAFKQPAGRNPRSRPRRARRRHQDRPHI
jgi:hypothetical protein